MLGSQLYNYINTMQSDGVCALLHQYMTQNLPAGRLWKTIKMLISSLRVGVRALAFESVAAAASMMLPPAGKLSKSVCQLFNMHGRMEQHTQHSWQLRTVASQLAQHKKRAHGICTGSMQLCSRDGTVSQCSINAAWSRLRMPRYPVSARAHTSLV
jgi:hypothetical protein